MKRTWNDHKHLDNLKKGKWTTKELDKLRKILCKYAKKHGIAPEQLGEICADTTPSQYANIWKKVAKFFPERSVQSVQNAAKRNFNPYNYKGPWAHREEQELIRYVAEHGHKWKTIAQILERTAVNVKDKWKQLGGDRKNQRKMGPWAVDEMVALVQLIMKNLSLPELHITPSTNESEVTEHIKQHVKPLRKQLLKQTVNWEAIAEQMLTRTAVDCRLKWNNLMNGSFAENDDFTPEQDMSLYKSIKAQRPLDTNDIDFSLVKNSRTTAENRSRWKILSKGISGRLTLSVDEVISKLEYAYEVAKPSEETIIDYFKKSYKK